jgi:integrase
MRLPTAQEVGALLEAADESFGAFLGLCAFAGLRLGEAAAIQVGDIDFRRRTLQVTRQVQHGEIRAPKYGSGRTVFLPDGLLAMLSHQVARRELRYSTLGYSSVALACCHLRITQWVIAGASPASGLASKASPCTTCATSTPPG